MHRPPAKSNFSDKHSKAQKYVTDEDYGQHMGYVNTGDRMANSYSISHKTWKWGEQLFHFLGLTTQKCIKELRKCCLTVVQNLMEMSASEPHPQSNPRGRPNPEASQMTHL
jgi:hypothetical protein